MRYRIPDETVFDTELATEDWVRPQPGPGVIAGTEVLYRSSKGRYFAVYHAMLGPASSCQLLTPEGATAWLIVNGFDLPDELSLLKEKVVE